MLDHKLFYYKQVNDVKSKDIGEAEIKEVSGGVCNQSRKSF